MNKEKLEPIAYSNEWFKGKRMYTVAGVLGLFAVASLALGIYLASFNGDWWVMLFFILFASVFSYFAYIFFPTEQKDIYRYELTNKGLYQQWVHRPTNQEKEIFTPFAEMNDVLIGMYVERIRIPNNKNYFRYYALLVIQHKDGCFFEKFLAAEDLQEWTKRFKGKVPRVRYTNFDLSQAYHALAYTKVDFSNIEGSEEDCVTDLVGRETFKNTIPSWQVEGIREEIQMQKETITLPKTRRAEKRTVLILFVYNLLFAVLVFPTTPMDEYDFIEMTDTILVGQLVVHLLIPSILVFWRRFTKWYLPIVLTFVSFLGLSLGTFILIIFTDLPFIYESIISLSIFNFALFVIALMSIKLFLFVANIMYEHNV